VGERIRAFRVARGLSQAELGSPYFTRAHVSAVELGKILPALTALAHFANRLEVSVRELLPP
jgi:transcriptional regulator with XRE-family HTH domain